MINLYQPDLGTKEIEAIAKVFKSNWIGKGILCDKFEEKFSLLQKSNKENFFSISSCTEGLFLSIKALDIDESSEVIVPSISFVAAGSAVLGQGVKLVICDVDPHSLNVRAEDIEKVVSNRTKAVIINHYGGHSAPMDQITEVCERYNIAIIEDAACAINSTFNGQACGTFGDISVWSFDAMKAISTGDGGMVYAKEKKVIERCKKLIYLGLPPSMKSGTDKQNSNPDDIWWDYQIDEFGRRSIMNDITASIGLEQLKRLPEFLTRRKEIFNLYSNLLKNNPLVKLPPKPHKNSTSSYYMFWIQTENRDKLAKFLKDNGVYTSFRYWPLNFINKFKTDNQEILPNTEFIAKNTLNLPMHTSLLDKDIRFICELINSFLK